MTRCAPDRPLVLVAAGTDPSGGAGLSADLRVLEQLGCWGQGVTTAVVVQSTLGVARFEPMTPELVADQWRAVLSDVGAPKTVKLGMLASAETAWTVGSLLAGVDAPIVCDPVLASGHGSPLSGTRLVDALRADILPAVTVLTPNAPEAERLLGWSPGRIDDRDAMCEAARELRALGPRAVLLKGGHVAGTPGDVLALGDDVCFLPNAEVLPGLDVHGTGCHLASAVAGELALQGRERVEASVVAARGHFARWLRERRWRPGRGREILCVTGDTMTRSGA